MKNTRYINLRLILLLSIGIVTFYSCERDFSDDVEFATFPPNGDVFIDTFSAGLDYFPFGGADPQAFSVETEEVFDGEASMRFDVPAFGNSFVGATFNTTARRDLSSFDALTFYAKASQAADINEIGFGVDGETANKFRVAARNLAVSTRWEKYVIPIPDATRLVSETGLLWLAEGASFEGDEGGYVLWLDEVKFEKLGTVAQPRPAIFGGEELQEQTFIGSTITVTGLTQTFNLGNGVNQTIDVAPSYYSFESSDNGVATVNELGQVNVIGAGTATISAIIAGVRAEGSLEVTSIGDFQAAPTPTRPSENVKSIFSDTYVSETESNFNPGFGGSTTEFSFNTLNNNTILNYSNNNFSGIIFGNTVDASGLTFLHVDVYVDQAGTEFEIQIRDIGANGEINTDVNTGLPIGDDRDRRFTFTGLTAGQWTSFDIPLDGDIASQKNNLGALILVGGPNFILDNIYFYTE
ncbi:glycosyl hydrolase family 16 [Flagellimonas meishanensis]|uniref:glycosyl hydrolase family 16 n=1 Tax=Flagellimonas meishanensis TaxID=2873264 RepID=UPI001CA645C4|nr:glycosyl hydrolase family 16 [[Muricauda] meishanensis]